MSDATSDPESDLVVELRVLAGVADGRSTFFLTHRGVRIDVDYTGGSSSSVLLSAPYNTVARFAIGYRGEIRIPAIRPLRITLTPETAVHREGKATGGDVEHQTGDAAFDDAVYIDTPTDDALLQQILGAEARRAVLDLFAVEFDQVWIDDHRGLVAARLVSFPSLREKKTPGAIAVDAFARLASSLPPLTAVDGEHPENPLSTRTTILGVIGIPSFFIAFPVYFGALVEGRCPDDMSASQAASCLGPGIGGTVIGGLVGLVVISLAGASARRRYQGRSDSSKSVRSYTSCLFVCVLVYVGLGASFLIVLATR